nr:reverse transcriptase domain-containing protein [Ectobacillus panaciterrae]
MKFLGATYLVVLTETKQQAQSIYEKIQSYLSKRGLELSAEKTRVTHIENGFDFLGFSIRQYKTWQGNKLLIKPSKDSERKDKGYVPYHERPAH